MSVTHESRAAAYNQAVEHLQNHSDDIGWFVCRRKDGRFVLWPMDGENGKPPVSYVIVDEVYEAQMP